MSRLSPVNNHCAAMIYAYACIYHCCLGYLFQLLGTTALTKEGDCLKKVQTCRAALSSGIKSHLPKFPKALSSTYPICSHLPAQGKSPRAVSMLIHLIRLLCCDLSLTSPGSSWVDRMINAT